MSRAAHQALHFLRCPNESRVREGDTAVDALVDDIAPGDSVGQVRVPQGPWPNLYSSVFAVPTYISVGWPTHSERRE